MLSIETGGEGLDVLIYVPPVDGKRIEAGMPALVSPATARHEEFGYIIGTVESLSEFPASLNGMIAVLQNQDLARTFSHGGPPYPGRVELALDPSTASGFAWTSPQAVGVVITPGTLATVEVETASQPPGRTGRAVDQGTLGLLNSDPQLQPNLKPRRGGRRAAPTILQMEATECAAACLSMILAYHGRWEPLETLRVLCGVSRDGANAANMLRAAREYGLVAQGFRSERPHLFDMPFPMIVFWEFNHFVVLEGIKGDKVYINDPSAGPRRISLQEFDESFTGVCFGFAPGPEFTEGGARPSVVRGLSARFGQAWQPLVFAALATLALIFPGVAIPTMIKIFIDDVMIGQNGTWVAPLLIGLTLVAAAQGALIWLQRTLLARMETKLSIVTTARFFWHVVTLPMLFFSQRYAGDIASRVGSNDRVARLLSGELAVNAINLLAMAFYAAVMLSYDAPLTLVALVMVAINLLVLQFAAAPARTRIAACSRNGVGSPAHPSTVSRSSKPSRPTAPRATFSRAGPAFTPTP